MIVLRIKRDLQLRRGDLIGITNGAIYRLERVSPNLNVEPAEDEDLAPVSTGVSAAEDPDYVLKNPAPGIKLPFKRNAGPSPKVHRWHDGEQSELSELVRLVIKEQGKPTPFRVIAAQLGLHHLKNKREYNMLTHVVREMFKRGELADTPIGGGEYKTVHAYQLADQT